jgi:hypothetical protein
MRGLFGSSREAHFRVEFAPKAPLRINSLKKHGENRRKSRRKWRKMALFRGPKPPFFRAPRRLHSIATRASARPYVHGAWLLRAASDAPNRQWGAIFRGPGHETIDLGRGDLTIAPIFRAVEASRALAAPSASLGFVVSSVWDPSSTPSFVHIISVRDAGGGTDVRRKRFLRWYRSGGPRGAGERHARSSIDAIDPIGAIDFMRASVSNYGIYGSEPVCSPESRAHRSHDEGRALPIRSELATAQPT